MKISEEAKQLIADAKSVSAGSHVTILEVLQAQQTADLSAVCQVALADRTAGLAEQAADRPAADGP